jgi:heme oxygenase
LARLRAGTREAHARIETVPALSRLMAPDLTHDEYIALLQHLHAFHTQFEPAIAAALEARPEAAAMLDGARPRALAEDLVWFGARPVMPPSLPRLDTTGAALGALYVIEGSGLGGRVIARHLMGSLGVGAGSGGSFYCNLSADAARQRWHRLCALLEPANGSDVDAAESGETERMVDGALQTFGALDRFLRQIAGAVRCGPTLAEAVAP